MKLEYVDSLTLAHPFVKGFEQVSYCMNEEEIRAVAQGDISETIQKRKKEDIEDKDGASAVHSTTFYIGLAIEPKQPGAVGPRRLDISYPTTEFSKMVKLWEKYDEDTMGIVVRHIKSSALPDYVFGKGERQPRSAQKRPKGSKGSGKSSNTSPDVPNKKRRASHTASESLNDTAGVTSNNNPTIPVVIPQQNSISSLESTIPGLEPLSTYTPVSQDTSRINTPRLPFGENVAIATNPVAAAASVSTS